MVICGCFRRDYFVVFQDDPPERAEAVRFFQDLTDCRLYPSAAIPLELEKMPIGEANAHLRQHPIQRLWSLLTIGHQSPNRDSDLARLRHLPEIGHIQIFSDQITDVGVKHLLLLGGLSQLILYSNQFTDECLRDIRQLRSLTSLDLQAASKVSREAVLATIIEMPWLQSTWPPLSTGLRR